MKNEPANVISPGPGPNVYQLFKHKPDCTWATELPTGAGYWGCNCGLDSLLIGLEDFELAAPVAAASAPLTNADYEEVLTDHRRLVRELDVLLNGEEGAAKQASLCDIVAQVSHEGIQIKRPAPVAPLDEKRLAEIRERESKATPGYWTWIEHSELLNEPRVWSWHYPDGTEVPETDIRRRPRGWSICRTRERSLTEHGALWPFKFGENGENDGEFIAHARADIPYLLEQIESLRRGGAQENK